MLFITKAKKNERCENLCETPAVKEVEVTLILPNRRQPRRVFEESGILRLADSIKRFGIIHPLTVRALHPSENPSPSYKYELVSGERRLRAAMLIGLSTVPCMIKTLSAEECAEIALIENLLRRDLNIFEQARAFKRLICDFGLTQSEVAERVSCAQSSVANKLRLLKLSEKEQSVILAEGLTERHARALLRITDEQKRRSTLGEIVQKHMNVSECEAYIDRLLSLGEEIFPAEGQKAEQKSQISPNFEAERVEKRVRRYFEGAFFGERLRDIRSDEDESSLTLTIVLDKRANA